MSVYSETQMIGYCQECGTQVGLLICLLCPVGRRLVCGKCRVEHRHKVHPNSLPGWGEAPNGQLRQSLEHRGDYFR